MSGLKCSHCRTLVLTWASGHAPEGTPRPAHVLLAGGGRPTSHAEIRETCPGCRRSVGLAELVATEPPELDVVTANKLRAGRARAIARLDLPTRRAYLEAIEAKEGKDEAELMRQVLMQLWDEKESAR